MFVSDFRVQAARLRGRPLATLSVFIFLFLFLFVAVSPAFARGSKLDADLDELRKHGTHGSASVIVTLKPGAQLPPAFKRFERLRGRLNIINGQVLDLPVGVLTQLERYPEIATIHYNRPVTGSNYRTSITTGARAVQSGMGLTGAGIGVAIIDSGITSWHDDLTNRSTTLYPYGDQRVAAFVDFVNNQTNPYDDQGHGTHVAGVIAGNGTDSFGAHLGAAPDATLVALKVLDANGHGTIANVIAALEWVLANHAQYNIRVANLSVGAPVRESYTTDPLTLAAKRVVDAGVVVVTAAGNHGRNASGEPLYGGITAPGNAPWVLTVGASSSQGTIARLDDTVAGFSSRGPTYLDWGAKPDVVAPGHGTISLADPLSAFFTSKAQFLVAGSGGTAQYLALSGTSMAAPVVSGTIALMLQANPGLTPNAVKAILQYTAQEYAGYNALTQGAGFLNTIGAVRLAQFFAEAEPGDAYPLQGMWSRKIIWGSHRLSGGLIDPSGNAFALSTTWGVARTDDDDNIIWGTICEDGCNPGDNIIWGTDDGDDNIIWGTHCDGGDCDNIIWGTDDDDDNIIWGTQCGGDDCDNIIWGTAADDNIIWGTDGDDDNIDNIIWGTAEVEDDNIIWGTDESSGDNIIWGTSADDENTLWLGGSDPTVTPFDWTSLFSLSDETIFGLLDGSIVVDNAESSTDEPASTIQPQASVVVDSSSSSTADSTSTTISTNSIGVTVTPDATISTQTGDSSTTTITVYSTSVLSGGL
jgi:serine protease AprX